MTDATWLRGIADSGWNQDEWSSDVKSMLRRVADRLDKIDRLESINAQLLTSLIETRAVAAALMRALLTTDNVHDFINAMESRYEGFGKRADAAIANARGEAPS